MKFHRAQMSELSESIGRAKIGISKRYNNNQHKSVGILQFGYEIGVGVVSGNF